MKHTNNKSSNKLLLVAFINLFIVAAEFLGGFFSGSLALLSDAGHNFSDVISLNVAYIGEKLSNKRSTKNNSFGLRRFEVFTSLFNAFSLCAIAVFIIYEAIQRTLHPQPISAFIILPVAIIGLAVNFASTFILHKDRNTNLNIKAAYLNLYYDTLSSVFIIIAGIVIYFTNLVILDIVISVVIAMLLLWSGFSIIRKALHILMEGIPEGIAFEEVHKDIVSIQEIESIHDLHIWSVNSQDSFLSCHACLKKTKDKNTDKIINKINQLIGHKYGIFHSAIQLETKTNQKKN